VIPTSRHFRLRWQDIVSGGVILGLLMIGEAPIIAVVTLSKFAASRMGGLSDSEVTLTVWAVSAILISLGGYFALGLPIIKMYERSRRGGPPPKTAAHDFRSSLAERLFKSGGEVAFLVACLIGGASPAAIWYARKADPHARKRTQIAAWILGISAPAIWLGLFTAQYRIAVISVLVIAAIGIAAYMALLSSQLWELLAPLYDSLFALRPHHDLVAEVAGKVDAQRSLLDAGCGSGQLGLMLTPAQRNDAVGLDVSRRMLGRARRRGSYSRYVQGSAAAMPFADDAFATVVSINVLYALPDPRAAIAELARILAPGGTLWLATPTTPELWPLVSGHFAVASVRDNLRLLLRLPQLLLWMIILGLRHPRFHFLSTQEVTQYCAEVGLTVKQTSRTYAGIDVLATITKPIER